MCAGMLGNVWEWVSGKAEGDGRKQQKKGKVSAKEKQALANQVIMSIVSTMYALIMVTGVGVHANYTIIIISLCSAGVARWIFCGHSRWLS
jgi:hypothetical protein